MNRGYWIRFEADAPGETGKKKDKKEEPTKVDLPDIVIIAGVNDAGMD